MEGWGERDGPTDGQTEFFPQFAGLCPLAGPLPKKERKVVIKKEQKKGTEKERKKGREKSLEKGRNKGRENKRKVEKREKKEGLK